MGKQNEVRGDWKATFVGSVAGWFAQLLVRTLQVEVEYRCEGPFTEGPYIFALWHNRLIGGTAAAKPWLNFRSAVVLTSASKDGATLAAAVEAFELGSIRGSSSRRGAVALVQLKRTLAKGQHVCITPDGPKGPCYKVQPGVVKLASISGVPIVPFLVFYEKYWQASSWDRFKIPKPFSKVKVIFGEAIEVPAKTSEEELEIFRKKVEAAMSEGLNQEET